MFKNSESHRSFERDLPGGGFVAIDVTVDRSIWRKPVFRGRVIVERRAVARGERHAPPLIATASGSNLDDVIRQLLPMAQCNSAIGAALLGRLRSYGKRPRVVVYRPADPGKTRPSARC